MKKILFLAIAILVSVTSFAQTEEGTIFVLPRVGATMCNYDGSFTDGQLSIDTKNHFGITAGVDFGYQVSKKFCPTVGVMYVNNGTKFKANDQNNTLVQETAANWLAFPFMANYYIVKGLAIKAGVQPALMMNSKDKVSGEGMYFKLNSLDFQFPVGLSFELLGFILDARYTYSTIKLERANYASIDGAIFKDHFKNHHFTLTLGYKFHWDGPKMPKHNTK